jgi:DNA replication protein DnaC
MARITLAFSDYIAERSRDFTSRVWVFAETDRWFADPAGPQSFIITGEPGIGKSLIST